MPKIIQTVLEEFPSAQNKSINKRGCKYAYYQAKNARAIMGVPGQGKEHFPARLQGLREGLSHRRREGSPRHEAEA